MKTKSFCHWGGMEGHCCMSTRWWIRCSFWAFLVSQWALFLFFFNKKNRGSVHTLLNRRLVQKTKLIKIIFSSKKPKRILVEGFFFFWWLFFDQGLRKTKVFLKTKLYGAKKAIALTHKRVWERRQKEKGGQREQREFLNSICFFRFFFLLSSAFFLCLSCGVMRAK